MFCKIRSGFLIGALLLSLSACGGGGGSDNDLNASPDMGDNDPSGSGSGETLLGQVADGYLVGARVFLDRNGNRTHDADEPMAESGKQGRFNLHVGAGEGELYPVVAEVIAGRTVDEDDGSVPVAESYLLESPPGRYGFISPLTTLVRNKMEMNPSMSEKEAEIRVREILAFSQDVSLFADYIPAANDSTAYLRAHRMATLIASLQGYLQAALEENIGGEIPSELRAAAVVLISDSIMSVGSNIAGLIDAGSTHASDLLPTILPAVKTENLTSEGLDLYARRLAEGHPLWDVSPPSILSRFPEPGGLTPTDGTISLTFSEPLQENALESSLTLVGPYGPALGSIHYDPARKTLVFTPSEPLLPLSAYQVALDATVRDEIGNEYGKEESWTFQTIFDESPPPPPDI